MAGPVAAETAVVAVVHVDAHQAVAIGQLLVEHAAITGRPDETFILGTLNPVTGEFKTFEVDISILNPVAFPIYGNFI